MTHQDTIRPAAVAGLFYPADPVELQTAVQQHLASAEPPPEGSQPPRVVIAPHAGYLYSGPVAGNVYRRLAPLATQVDRVYLVGPAHRVRLAGVAAPTATEFATPLRNVRVDQREIERLVDDGICVRSDAPHAQEHSLEVHLPFLIEVLGEFSIVPLVVGDCAPSKLSPVIDQAWEDPTNLVVISSDLSHYHAYDVAKERDAQTAEAIVRCQPDDIEPGDACGRVPIQAALHAAKRRGAGVELLDLRSSGDTAGGREQVVGYGAFAIA